MNPENAYCEPSHARRFFTDHGVWATLNLPLPELPRVVAALAAVMRDEQAEAHLAAQAERLGRVNVICDETITLCGFCSARFQSARRTVPLPVFVSALRAASTRLFDNSSQEGAWRSMVAVLEGELRNLELAVGLHVTGDTQSNAI